MLIVEYVTFILARTPSISINIPPKRLLLRIPNCLHFFALSRSANYSSGGGRTPKPSAWVIAHGVGMTPMHLVWASSSDMPWYGPKPLGAMVDTKHVK